MDLRYTAVPPLESGRPAAVADALPTDPAGIDDCCRWLVDKGAVEDANAARTWLSFGSALGLVAETGDGYARVDPPPDDAAIRRAFVDSVYGARELLAVVRDEQPVGADRLSRVLDSEGERGLRAPTTVDREAYVDRLLDWAERFDVVVATDQGYRPGPGSSDGEE